MQQDVSRTYFSFAAYIQAICIVLVVIGHSFHEYPESNHGYSLMLVKMIYSFHMPAFMFVSGFLMMTGFALKTSNDGWKFFKSKSRRLLLPYIVLSVVTYFPRVALGEMADDKIPFSWNAFSDALIFSDRLVIPYFWFVQALFLLLIFGFAVIRIAERCSVNTNLCLVGLTVLFIVLPLTSIREMTFFSIGKAAELGLFFVAGMVYSKVSVSVARINNKIIATLFFCFMCIWILTYFGLEGSQLFVLCQIFGVAMLVAFAYLLSKRNYHMLKLLAESCFMIFLLSWYFNVASQQVLSHFIRLPWYIHTAFSVFFGIIVPIMAYLYLKKHQNSRWCRVTAYILGQRFSHKISHIE